MFIYALKSNLLSPHQPLQQIAKQVTRRVVKRGDKGVHIMAVQQSLNSIFRRHRMRGIPKAWHYLEVDGKFGGNTFSAVQAFQDYANRKDRVSVREMAREFGGAARTQAYKKVYADSRFRLAADGLVGARTLLQMDSYLIYQ